MSKNHRAVKEYTREQRLIKENERLKREVAKYRKLLARLDLDRYSTIKDMIEEHQAEDNQQKTLELLESLKEIWKCRDCSEGYLEIIVYSKVGNPWYFRSCNSCKKRTKSQPYDESRVKGIIKK